MFAEDQMWGSPVIYLFPAFLHLHYDHVGAPLFMFCLIPICFRSASLAHVNSMLREQLDQATSANQALTADIHKLTKDWQRAREELEMKEAEWREEEQVMEQPL